ncbi:MAG TPA: tRNA (adenosine(37)-N6)-threonylcarbamoyltransferase complex transferase subunit TsaD [Candidatus Bathyarchaeia archaeon]|nr:tRNA (adenosine(37)-N6)-threonylcarbamoyltransferase complex transferase subunit TsaD [Candidatus Bathyarchaeia archaeon]
MRILGIETSCDETAVAVVEDGTKILTNTVASSVKLHQKTGGIIPEVAAREQIRMIIPVLTAATKPFQPLSKKIDALAVTVGPGLIGSLLVGVETAKTLAYVWQKPLVPVNHLQAHLYANWLEGKKPTFPALGLVVSGGHTELVLIKDYNQIKWLGGTRDDAAGECFDKTARFLHLGYPGGPAIARKAEKGSPDAYDLPRPMINQKNLDFSFAGLKTAVINLARKEKKVNQADLAASIQAAIVEVLVEKTIRAAKKFPVKSILLAGGVAANQSLREKFQSRLKEEKIAASFFAPPPELATDNATCIASYAYFNPRPVPWSKVQANPGLRIC